MLFPSRVALYQAAHDNALAAIADGTAKTQGTSLCTTAAYAVLTLRLNDRRSVVLAAYVPGTAPGQFRTANAAGVVGQMNPFIRPFNETKALGVATSSMRTAEQADVSIACFEAKYFYNAWRPTAPNAARKTV